MTPDAIAEAVYELGQAAATLQEARLGGSELGTMLANQADALKGVWGKDSKNCKDQIESVLQRLNKNNEVFHTEVAQATLDAWYLRFKVINTRCKQCFL